MRVLRISVLDIDPQKNYTFLLGFMKLEILSTGLNACLILGVMNAQKSSAAKYKNQLQIYLNFMYRQYNGRFETKPMFDYLQSYPPQLVISSAPY